MNAQRLDEDAILVVLEALSGEPLLFNDYALKGGTALRLAYQGPRASVDVDLSSMKPYPNQTDAESQTALADFCNRLDGALASVANPRGITDIRVQSRRVLPGGSRESRTFPAFKIKVGYSRKGIPKPPYSDFVGLDVTLNDVVCEAEIATVDGIDVHVSSLQDIVAEKLRALLQQVTRNRQRPGDVYDLWFLTSRFKRLLDPAEVARFLVEKSSDKEGLEVITKSLFHNPDVNARARTDYDEIAERLRDDARLPDFDYAFSQILRFVDGLPLPD